MTHLFLAIAESEADSALADGNFDEVFLWSTTDRSSFSGGFDPYLSRLGTVNPRNIDFVRIALGVLASDRSVLRESRGSSWNSRNMQLTVQVSDPAVWASHSEQLSKLIGFLSGDNWSFEFVAAPVAEANVLPLDEARHDRTVLLSGGADSAAGALLSAIELSKGHSQALVSQFSSNSDAQIQKLLVASIQSQAKEVNQIHHQFNLHRLSLRLDGTPFRDESSTRSRSLLYLALGLAVAERSGSILWIAENGFASLNPPLGPDRRGSLSTKTTQPRLLRDVADLMNSVEGHGLIENPFERYTKGEMFRRVAEAIGADQASIYLSSTKSCAHKDGRFSGAPVGSSCGVCYGCLVRRASFIAANIPDATTYLVNDKSGRFDDYIRSKSIVEPMRDFVDRGVRPRDAMAISLPPDYSASEALDLCHRGVRELRSLFL